MAHGEGAVIDVDEGTKIEELAVAARAGDGPAMDELLARIQPRVRQICGRILLYPEDADEAAQDALLAVATKLGTFSGRSKFTTWMYTVASNSARATYRSLKRRAVERATAELPLQADPRTTSVIAGSRLDLLEALETIGAEHPEYVEPLVLRDVQRLDYAEIADVLDIPLGTVKSRIHAARKAIQPLLKVVG